MDIVDETILKIIREWASQDYAGDFVKRERSLSGLNKREIARLEEKAQEMRIYPLISRIIPSWDELRRSKAEASQLRQSQQLVAIKMLAEASEERGVRFVLFKGMASAVASYGDVSIRESSDIDVLIDSKDIAQLDLVLKSIGFSQIAQFDDMSFSNKLAVKYLQAMYSNHQLPPTKKKTHDVQYRPYYSKRLGIRIEVHDGIYYVPSCYIPEMIWHTCILKLPNCSVRQLDLEHSLAVLILTAYENSENIYAGFDGEANLRDYCDIVSFFKLRGRDLDIDRFREITKNLNIENILEIVSRNMQIIFGFTPFKGIGFSIETNLGITEQTLLERLFDKQANRAYAKKELKRRVLESQTVVNEGEIVPVPTIHNLGIGVRIYRESSNIVVEWIVPISIKHDLSFLGLQLGIVSTSDSPFVEGLASISDASRPNNAVWSTKERACQILIRTKQLGTALETFKEEHDSVIVIGAIIPIELIATDDCELGIVPMVYVKASSNSYRTINISSSHFENPWLLSWKDRCPPASPAR